MTLAALSIATDTVYGTFGVPAGYTPKGSEVVTPCTVLVERDLTRFGEVARINARTAIVCVRKSELAEAPMRGDTFSLSSGAETLKVDSLQASDEFEHRVYAA